MKFKKIIAISMIISGCILVLILITGLLIPESLLLKLSKHKPVTETQQVVRTTSDGKQVVETVNPVTGEKTVVTTDPKTGNTETVVTTASGEEKIVSATAQPTTSNPTTGTPSTPTQTPPSTPTNPGGGTVAKPVVSVSVSPSSITAGASATLGWSATNSPTSCTAGGGWSGSKAASGTLSVKPGTTTSYTLSCSNAGGSGSASATLTVSQPVQACGSGGACHLSDISGHNTASNCRAAINKNGSGMGAYAIPSSFLSTHQPKKSITSLLCGKVYASNLRNATSDHRGPTLGGSTYDTWMSNFYIGPYN